jgi:hypothetical protein
VRLAYGYAQYDYPQCRSFVFITDAFPAAAGDRDPDRHEPAPIMHRWQNR